MYIKYVNKYKIKWFCLVVNVWRGIVLLLASVSGPDHHQSHLPHLGHPQVQVPGVPGHGSVIMLRHVGRPHH